MSEKRNEFIEHLKNIRETMGENVDESNMFWASRIESERLTREEIARKQANQEER